MRIGNRALVGGRQKRPFHRGAVDGQRAIHRVDDAVELIVGVGWTHAGRAKRVHRCARNLPSSYQSSSQRQWPAAPGGPGGRGGADVAAPHLVPEGSCERATCTPVPPARTIRPGHAGGQPPPPHPLRAQPRTVQTCGCCWSARQGLVRRPSPTITAAAPVERHHGVSPCLPSPSSANVSGRCPTRMSEAELRIVP